MGSKKGKKRGHYGPPTRAELAIKIMKENGGVVSKAMREAGFSEEYARQPQKFMATRTFQELANIMLPDINLLEKHTEILSSSKLDSMKFPKEISEQEIIGMLYQVGCMVQKIFQPTDLSDREVYFIAPDNKARMDAIDLAYKIKGHMKAGTGGNIIPLQVNFNELREKYNK